MKTNCLEALKLLISTKSTIKTLEKQGDKLFTDEMLNTFLDLSLSNFNQIPYFTSYTFDNKKFMHTFISIIVEGAFLYALAFQALAERTKEVAAFSTNTQSLSNILQEQYNSLTITYLDKLKLIKSHIKFALDNFNA